MASAKQRNTGTAVVASRQEIRSGPLPAQQEFEGYERTLPGAAERIMAMAEREQRISHKLALRDYWLRVIGLISGFVLGAAGIGIAYYMVSLDKAHVQHVVYAIAIVIGAALAGRFIGRRAS